MQLVQRLGLLNRLRKYMLGNDAQWLAAKQKAAAQNGWFIPAFIDLAVNNIAARLLDEQQLPAQAAGFYDRPQQQLKTVGVILPGNIPLGGFCDIVYTFLSGHRQRIRTSPKDDVLPRHLVHHLISLDSAAAAYLSFHDMLKGCDAYLATGAASSPPMEHYFGRYPSIIASPARAAALLDGTESRDALEALADDILHYFGQGHLNVSKIYVPRDYDFIPLLKALGKYQYLADLHKYKNNYDYQLSLLILNKQFYMTNGCILLTENKGTASPAAQLYFEYYDTPASVTVSGLAGNGPSYRPFGQGQQSVLSPDAGRVLQFLREL